MNDFPSWKPDKYSFLMTRENEKVIVNLGGEEDVVLSEILRSFKGFLVACGFNYVTKIEALTDTSNVHSSEND
tara:strand:- start:6 stop:224 length:219 start_codon:yes stop_codon:yes gene_type:complete